MLYISFNSTDTTLEGVASYFNVNYLDEWFEDPLVKEMIEGILNAISSY